MDDEVRRARRIDDEPHEAEPVGEDPRDEGQGPQRLAVARERDERPEGHAPLRGKRLLEQKARERAQARPKRGEKKKAPAPAEGHGDLAAQDRREARPHAEEHGDERDDPRRVDALPAVADDRLAEDWPGGGRDAHDEAPEAERFNRVGAHGGEARGCKCEGCNHQHALAPEGVRDRADEERRDGEAREIDRERLLHGHGRGGEIPGDLAEGRNVRVGGKGAERADGGEKHAVRELRPRAARGASRACRRGGVHFLFLLFLVRARGPESWGAPFGSAFRERILEAPLGRRRPARRRRIMRKLRRRSGKTLSDADP